MTLQIELYSIFENPSNELGLIILRVFLNNLSVLSILLLFAY